MANKILKTCAKGHQFYKSSDCPSCPICAKIDKPEDGFLKKLSAPARRALMGHGITSLAELAKYSEAQILNLHGLGPSSLPSLNKALAENNLSFRENSTT